jgi:hypothetical protein
VIVGVIGMVVVIRLVQATRKCVYGKAVYQEVDRIPEGQQIISFIQNHPDEKLRMYVEMMQLEVIKCSFRKGSPPSIAAQVMIGAVNEMLNEGEDYS